MPGVQAGVLWLNRYFSYTCLSALAALFTCLLSRYGSRLLAPEATNKQLQQLRAPSIAARRSRGPEAYPSCEGALHPHRPRNRHPPHLRNLHYPITSCHPYICVQAAQMHRCPSGDPDLAHAQPALPPAGGPVCHPEYRAGGVPVAWQPAGLPVLTVLGKTSSRQLWCKIIIFVLSVIIVHIVHSHCDVHDLPSP